MLRVTFVGTGEAFDPELPNTSVLVEGRKKLLVDCGYSAPRAVFRLWADAALLDGVYLTHQHADHSFGLPALLMWMRTRGRRRPLALLGGPGSTAWMREILELGYPGAYEPGKCFPIEWIEVPAEHELAWGPMRLRSARSQHSVANDALRVEDDGVIYCQSGDGKPTIDTRHLFRGADLLVHECYGVDPAQRHHAHAAELIEMAAELAVSTLCLVHVESDASVKRAVSDISGQGGAARVLLPAPGDSFEVSHAACRAG